MCLLLIFKLLHQSSLGSNYSVTLAGGGLIFETATLPRFIRFKTGSNSIHELNKMIQLGDP